MVAPPEANPELLVELANTRMPFGKYKGRRLLELPDAYLAWFKRHGFPRGKLGMLMETALEVRLNGLEGLVRPLIDPGDPEQERGRAGKAEQERAKALERIRELEAELDAQRNR